MPDRLRALWDFDELEATRARFREALDDERSGPRGAEILTQLARIEGLQGDCGAGDALLTEAEALAGDDPRARVRIALERGRLRNSAGNPEGARPLFAQAFELAFEADDRWLAADAAHMAAMAAADDADREAWTERGLEAATSSPAPKDGYWAGPLLNNLGWARYEAGRFPEALEAFEAALQAREREPDRPRRFRWPGTRSARHCGRWAVPPRRPNSSSRPRRGRMSTRRTAGSTRSSPRTTPPWDGRPRPPSTRRPLSSSWPTRIPTSSAIRHAWSGYEGSRVGCAPGSRR